MKVRNLSLFIFMLLNLYSCLGVPEEGLETETSVALRCTEFRDADCDMNWYIQSSSESFPKNVELLINDTVIFNECQRDVNVAVSRTNLNVEIVIYKYANLTAGVPFGFAINDLGDCYSEKTQFYSRAVQPYEIKEINSTASLVIKI